MAKPYINFVHPEDRKLTQSKLSEIYAGQIVSGFENRYLCKDGRFKWFLWNAVPLLEQKMAFMTARDISDRKLVEEEIMRAMESMEAASNAKKRISRQHEPTNCARR